jgi:hypothetical protein
MQVRYHDHGQITDEVHRVVGHELRVVERRLEDIAYDLKVLGVTVEHHPRDDTYTARLVLELPNRTLAAAGHGTRRGMAVRDAFRDLGDELDVYLAKLRGEPGERVEGKFHVSAQALHRDALCELESSLAGPPAEADG